MAELLDTCGIDDSPAAIGLGSIVGAHAVLGPRVVIGRNVVIGPSCVIGEPGFGWATGPNGRVRHVPQLGGVVIEDDVHLGALCTVDAGTHGPTIIRRGAKLDAHVHVGHNTEIGEGCIIAAQTGFAGSVRLGKGVLVGGQAGFADHVTIGDGARVAAKSGVIGDVPAGATVAGYPAVLRARWFRAWGWVHRSSARDRKAKP
ncbi:MAG: UDP-3-O-[3-hydroxymyristoyl] glucosamine N-acyltransferase [Myxococcaceae bacterium]|nr:UDP-3-O-[3-hydroxymyristoyl] glucosamine N-acyltransferase [Myxococcaceae bacterium]